MIPDIEFTSLIVLLIMLVLGIIFVVVLMFLSKIFEQKEKRFVQSLNLAFFKIEKKFFEKPEFSAVFYDFLHSFKENWFRTFEYGKYWVVFEIIKWPARIEVYFGCQRKEKKFILDNFSRFWPDFKIREAKVPNYFGPGETAQGLEISLEKPFLLPIKTHKLSNDLFEKTIEIFNQSRGKIVMQVLARPIFYSVKKALMKEKSIISNRLNLGLVAQKVAKPAFECNVRFLSPAKDLMESGLNLVAPRRLFEEVKDNDYNNLKVEEPDDLNKFVFNFIFRIFEPHRNVILNSEELATIFYL